jgi:alkylation response protein AidB-like acyl-CoA dehydrogenase
MDFQLTEEQELIRRNAREFALKHVDPIAAKIAEIYEGTSEAQRMVISGSILR